MMELEQLAAGSGQEALHAAAALEQAHWLQNLSDHQEAAEYAQKALGQTLPVTLAGESPSGPQDGNPLRPGRLTLRWYIANKDKPVSSTSTITVFEVAYCYLCLKLDGGITDVVFKKLLNVACKGGLLAPDNIMPRCGPAHSLCLCSTFCSSRTL
jgi:hypothetical protein